MTYCSVEKNTRGSRFYNGLTAKYNIYFNGYESFKAGIKKLNKGYKDDYSQMLKVFEYSDPSSSQLCSSDMEKAIQKASKLITIKSITAKPEIKGQPSDADKAFLNRKEYNEWVDDAYLLIAKARFYKHEYDESATVMKYCIANANDPLIKKEASIWLARVYNETANYTESARLISEFEVTSDFPNNISSLYFTTQADLYIKQKKFPEAVEPLEKAIELSKGKRQKYRLTYLLAQLYQQTGDAEKATQCYREVVKFNPPYDVEFNARINIAGVFDVNSGNPTELKRELEKMLRDSKNDEFQDQIYYALGNLLMKEGKENEAVVYFRKSASSSSGNQSQKGKSYLALADHFYAKPDYLKAGRYYDSAVYFIDSKSPDYLSLKAKSLNLNSLVSQLTIIQTEDSLQKVAAMPDAARNNLIASIIAKIVKDESEGKLSEYADRSNMGQFYENQRRFQGNIDQEGKWYFYNQSALTFGRTEFRRRWGDRKLEDNWRRTNKNKTNLAQTATGADETAKNDADTSKAARDYKKPEFYLKKLPLTDSLLKISNTKITNALMNAGKAYNENINDAVRATETYDKLLSRFPGSDLVPEALYNIYKINKDINKTRSEAARQILLSKYSDSEFARILSDPGYYEKKMASLKMAEKLYNDAYDAYKAENFTLSMAQCDDGLKRFPKDDLAPKFQLLHAYATARNGGEKPFRDELNKVIKGWPKSAESKKASDILSFLNQKTPEFKVAEEKVIAAELFVADTTLNHVFVLIIPDPAFNINLATFDVISFNIDNYTNKNYRTEGAVIGNKYLMITVSGFSDFRQATAYFKSFRTDKVIRNSTPSMMAFLINDKNLKVLNGDKNPDRYNLFFKEKYYK